MNKMMIGLGALAVALAAPAIAQDMAAGTMTPDTVGAQPMMGTPSPNYVAWAADGDMYEIQSSKLALTKSKSPETKSFAKEMIADHMTTTKTLKMALPKTDPKVPPPPMKPSDATAAKLAALKSASADDFDKLYFSQQAEAHKMAWSLHKGYATDGADPALKQVAMSAVPIIEKHLQHLKSMPGAM